MGPIKEALTFDDVTLAPNYSEILPSQTETKTVLSKNLTLKIPLLSSAMDTVTESKMAIAIAKEGGIGVIHRNLNIKKQIFEIKKVKSQNLKVGAAVGAGPKEILRAEAILKEKVDLIVVDTAHGHSMGVQEVVKRIKRLSNRTQLIAGNIATVEGAKALIDCGADAVKIGIGPGSICTTRVVAGVGVPQFSAIMEASEECHKHGVPAVADGGIKYPGDIAKAIAAGADCVMIGSLLAGTDEAPGDVFLYQGRSYKSYRGMGSLGAMARGSADRYFQQEVSDALKLVPEGIEGQVPFKGAVSGIIHQMVGGLRAAMGYTGNATITEMQKNCKFLRSTESGRRESHVHDVTITREAPNYRKSE